MKHRGLFPIGWTPLADTMDRDASLCPSVRSFVRLLDGVWHTAMLGVLVW